MTNDKTYENTHDKTDAASGGQSSEEARPSAAESGTAEADAPQQRGSGGRGVALLALLVALLASAGAGYLYYELVYQDPLRAATGAQDARLQEVAASLSSLQADQGQQAHALADMRATLDDRLAATEQVCAHRWQRFCRPLRRRKRSGK